MGQREHFRPCAALVVVGVLGTAAFAHAKEPGEPPNDGGGILPTGPAPAASEDPALPFALSLGGGYAFRPHADGRNHGGAAHLYGDVPLGFYDLGLRLEVGGLAYGPSPAVPAPIALPHAGGSLVYAFDDTDAVAVVGIGGFVTWPVDLALDQQSAIPSGGLVASLGLRFFLIEGVRAEAGIRVPFLLFGPAPPEGAAPASTLGPQVALTGGLVLVPAELWAAYLQ